MVFKKLFKILKRTLRFKIRPSRKRKKSHRKKIRQRKRIHRIKSRKIHRIRKRKRHVLKPQKRKTIKARDKEKLDKSLFIGEITHYYPKVHAAVVKLKKPLSIGEPIRIKGRAVDFRQTVGSLQIDRKPIERARAGQEIGLEVFKEVQTGDAIYKSI